MSLLTVDSTRSVEQIQKLLPVGYVQYVSVQLPAGCDGILSCFSKVIFAFNILIIISTQIAANRDLAIAESKNNIDF